MLSAALFSVLFLAGCENDPLTGTRPDTPLLDQNPALVFSGLYKVSDGCYDPSATYEMTIIPFQGKSDEIVLTNFMNRNLEVLAHYENQKFVIPLQHLVTETGTMRVSGEVFAAPTEGVEIVYRLRRVNEDISCGATCVPKGVDD